MAAAAVQGTEHESKSGTLKDGAVDPDQWDQKCQVCSDGWLYLGDRFDIVDISLSLVEDEIRKAIRDIDDSASPHHMYVPGGEKFQADGILAAFLPIGIGLLQVEVHGAAPDDAQAHWESATSGSTDFEEVGQAFHFLQDVSHPLHTGSIGPQVLDTQGTIHFAYKQFIEDNWSSANDTSKSFSQRFSEGMNNPQWDGSMQAACETVAGDSTNYSDQVYETIVENGPNNRDDWDDFVENSAYSCMWFAGAYSRGAVNKL